MQAATPIIPKAVELACYSCICLLRLFVAFVSLRALYELLLVAVILAAAVAILSDCRM